jgi:hypothetical protein
MVHDKCNDHHIKALNGQINRIIMMRADELLKLLFFLIGQVSLITKLLAKL